MLTCSHYVKSKLQKEESRPFCPEAFLGGGERHQTQN